MVFYNGTTEDFHTTWDGIPYTFKANTEYTKIAIADNGEDSVKLTDAVCTVLAHHLATKVFNTPSLDANFRRNKEGETVGTFDRQERVYHYANLEALKTRFTTSPDVHVDLSDVLTSLPAFTGEKPAPEEDDDFVETPAKSVKKMGRPAKKVEPVAEVREPIEKPIV